MSRGKKSTIFLTLAGTIVVLIAWGSEHSKTIGAGAWKPPGFFEAKPIPKVILEPEYIVTDRAITMVKVPWGQAYSSYSVSVPMEMWVNDHPKVTVLPGKEPELGNSVQTLRFRCIDQPRGIVSFYEERRK